MISLAGIYVMMVMKTDGDMSQTRTPGPVDCAIKIAEYQVEFPKPNIAFIGCIKEELAFDVEQQLKQYISPGFKDPFGYGWSTLYNHEQEHNSPDWATGIVGIGGGTAEENIHDTWLEYSICVKDLIYASLAKYNVDGYPIGFYCKAYPFHLDTDISSIYQRKYKSR
jgi:hypothetical protein